MIRSGSWLEVRTPEESREPFACQVNRPLAAMSILMQRLANHADPAVRSDAARISELVDRVSRLVNVRERAASTDICPNCEQVAAVIPFGPEHGGTRKMYCKACITIFTP